MPGMCRIPEEISYGSDGAAEPQPRCLMHKQVVFLAKHLGAGKRGDKGQGRQGARVSEVPQTLASTSEQVKKQQFMAPIQGQGAEGGAKKSPGHGGAAFSHASQTIKMKPVE